MKLLVYTALTSLCAVHKVESKMEDQYRCQPRMPSQHTLICNWTGLSNAYVYAQIPYINDNPSPYYAMRFPYVALAIKPNANEMYMQRK